MSFLDLNQPASQSLFGDDSLSPELAATRTVQELLSIPADKCTVVLNSKLIPLVDLELSRLNDAIQRNALHAITGVWEWHTDGVLRVEAICRKPDMTSAGIDGDALGFWLSARRRDIYVTQGTGYRALPESINNVRFPIRLSNPCSPVTMLQLSKSYNA